MGALPLKRLYFQENLFECWCFLNKLYHLPYALHCNFLVVTGTCSIHRRRKTKPFLILRTYLYRVPVVQLKHSLLILLLKTLDLLQKSEVLLGDGTVFLEQFTTFAKFILYFLNLLYGPQTTLEEYSELCYRRILYDVIYALWLKLITLYLQFDLGFLVVDFCFLQLHAVKIMIELRTESAK